MEFDRIQQLAGTAKVARANSEQQRRRREQNSQDFSGLLEENLDEVESEETESSGMAPAALSQDTVSISSSGKESAETLHAAGSLARISLAQRQMAELFDPTFNTLADAATTPSEDDGPLQIDEVV